MFGGILGDEGKKAENNLENQVVGSAEKNVPQEEIDRRKNALEEKKNIEIEKKIDDEKNKMKEAKKKQPKMRLVLTSEEWMALPDPIAKSDLLKYSKDQKANKLNASKMATDSFNKTKAAISEVGNQTTKIFGTPGQATGTQPEGKKGLLGLGWFGLGGRKRRRRKKTRKKRKKKRKKSRRKTKRRR